MTESEFVRGLSLNILCCLVAYTFQPTVRVLHETSRVQTIIFQGHDCLHHAADLRALILFPLIVHANSVVLHLLYGKKKSYTIFDHDSYTPQIYCELILNT